MPSQADSLNEEKKNQAMNHLQTLAKMSGNYQDWDNHKKQGFSDQIAQIQSSIENGKSPDKEQFDQLIKLVAGHEDLTTVALKIGENFGYLPSL